ncbi:MAG: hypothetical protein LBT67_02710 [Holosporaceae bacterium]|jgi:hypothetical protein|nr:hypothetical protein [Holosporaceae bacterium]
MRKLTLSGAIMYSLASLFEVAAEKTASVDLSLEVIPEFELNVSPSSDKIEMVVHQNGEGKYLKSDVVWKNASSSITAPAGIIPIDFILWTTLPAGTSLKVSGTEYSGAGNEFRLLNKGKDGLTQWTGASAGPEYISFRLKKLTEGSGDTNSEYISNGDVPTSPTISGSEAATTQEISVGEHITFGIEFTGGSGGYSECLANGDLISHTVFRERLLFTFISTEVNVD